VIGSEIGYTSDITIYYPQRREGPLPDGRCVGDRWSVVGGKVLG